MSRTGKTAINTVTGLICTIISSILSFVLQAVFIRLLGLEYAGINSLFTDILSVLNLADLGFSNAILFRLYKSISDRDDRGTEMYLTLYRKICYIVAALVGVAGLCCIPFLRNLVNEAPTFSEPLWTLYVIILATSVANHLVNYKSILLIAKQDRFISTIIQYGCIFLRNGLQIVSIAAFHSIYLYLAISLLTTLIQGFATGLVSKKKYHLSWQSKQKVPREDARSIKKDVGALSVYKLCRTLDATVDTFLISKFVDVATTAIYGSITMLLNALNELLGVFNDGMIASVGDLNASGNKERLSEVFYQSFHFSFLIYGAFTAAFVPFISTFTKWWIGYTLDEFSICLMLLNFLMYGFGMNVATFRNSMGIFQKGWIRPAITALLNLTFSLLLIRKIGLTGTLLGTLIARTLTLVWYDPWLVIRHGMRKSPTKYYLRYVMYLLFVSLTALSLCLLNGILPQMTGLFSLIWHGLLYFLLAVGSVLAFGSLVPEQKKLLHRLFAMKTQILIKFKRGKELDE